MTLRLHVQACRDLGLTPAIPLCTSSCHPGSVALLSNTCTYFEARLMLAVTALHVFPLSMLYISFVLVCTSSVPVQFYVVRFVLP